MSTLATVTVHCVHCTRKTDVAGSALAEQRDVHELMHPGGTVIVGGNGVPALANPKPVAENLGHCTKAGCERDAVERRKVGRGYANYCQEHLEVWLEQRRQARWGKKAPAAAVTVTPIGTLVDLAQGVEDARTALSEATVAYADALRAALAAVESET